VARLTKPTLCDAVKQNMNIKYKPKIYKSKKGNGYVSTVAIKQNLFLGTFPTEIEAFEVAYKRMKKITGFEKQEISTTKDK